MKRRGWVTEQVADMENLRLAYWKAKRGKNAQKDVLSFSVPTLDENLIKLRNQILTGNVEVGNYNYFRIFAPKERLICAAPFPQRVLHHAIMNVCHEDFDRKQIFDSYASRLGKGTYAALRRAMGFHRRYRYCLKLDVRKFFDSIDHEILLTQLERMYKDPTLLLIFSRIIGSFCTLHGKGLPIGNLTSQYLANHYLSVLDHKAKESFNALAYVRYMDDVMVWDNDRERLKDIGIKLRTFLEQELKLTLKELQLRHTGQNTTFLGYKVSSSSMKLSNRSLARYKMHVKQLYFEFDKGIITQEEMNLRLRPILAFAEKANSIGIRRQVMEQCI